MAIDKDNLIQIKDYGESIYVHKTTHKVYRIGANGSLLEIKFYREPSGHLIYSNPAHGWHYLNRGRLLALALLSRPEGATKIRHKDGDVTNDKLSNLEWVVPGSPKDWTDRYREQNVNLSFWDSKHNCCRQKWCDKQAVKHLLHLKPKARGEWQVAYAPKSKSKSKK